MLPLGKYMNTYIYLYIYFLRKEKNKYVLLYIVQMKEENQLSKEHFSSI